MNKNLLIIGAGCCGVSAKEIAQQIGCFEKIGFLDDNIQELPDGERVLGRIDEYEKLALEYNYIFVAIGNPAFKLKLLQKIKETTAYNIATLISPQAYISPSAQIMQGTIIEAMAVVNSGSVIAEGCIIGAGSVVNHFCTCCEGVHLECHATVADNTTVPAGTDIASGMVYQQGAVGV